MSQSRVRVWCGELVMRVRFIPAGRHPRVSAPRKRASALVGALVILGLGTGCGSDDEAAATSPNGQVAGVDAVDNLFVPETVEVVAGTEVRWENVGQVAHNIRPEDDGQDWGVEIAGFLAGDVYTHLFDVPGVYPYVCSLHVGMIGTVVVQPAEPEAGT